MVPAATSFASRTSTSITEPGFDFQTCSKEATVTEPFSLPDTSAAELAAGPAAAAVADADAGAPFSFSHSG